MIFDQKTEGFLNLVLKQLKAKLLDFDAFLLLIFSNVVFGVFKLHLYSDLLHGQSIQSVEIERHILSSITVLGQKTR